MSLKCSLASMDGMTHAAFRSICFEYGAHGASTEMIPAISYARARKKRMPVFESLLCRRSEEGYLAAQIIGGDPADMAEAALRLEALERYDAIEINMGCPARKVVGSGNGSALLNDPERAGRILRAVCESVCLPVRLKMRLGWDEMHINADQIARIAQDSGCASIILHGRTRSMMYQGEVLMDQMRLVREAVQIPVVPNGAVTDARSAIAFAEAFGSDSVCIGRAALKNPWIFDDIRLLEAGKETKARDARERADVLIRFAQRLCLLKPERFAMPEMRKFCNWYLSGLSGWQDCVARLYECDDFEGFRRTLETYVNELARRSDMQIHPELASVQTLDTVSWFA